MCIGSKWVINNDDGAPYGRAYGKRGCNPPLYVKLARQGRVSYRVHSNCPVGQVECKEAVEYKTPVSTARQTYLGGA